MLRPGFTCSRGPLEALPDGLVDSLASASGSVSNFCSVNTEARYIMPREKSLLKGFVAVWLIWLVPCVARAGGDEPEIKVGERLFLETRFAQFFRANSNDPNQELIKGDPALDATATTTGNLMGHFRGKSMNCRACHLVDEQEDLDHPHSSRGGMRSYSDFAQRSPIPNRNDGKTITLRNSPALVGSGLGALLHFDAEFETLEDLVVGTFTGRNFGWIQGEESQANAHIVDVIKRDDGTYPLSRESGGGYREVLKGSASVPEEYRLKPPYAIDVDTASDSDIIAAVAKLVAAYVRDLSFFPDDDDSQPVKSPFDVFVEKNNLPDLPGANESPLAFARRFRESVEFLKSPIFITAADGSLAFHEQDFQFGEREFRGLRVFLAEPPASGAPSGAKGIGNCIACHSPPHFTDFRFHNTGISQEEYDSVHGDGEFNKIAVPTFDSRRQRSQLYLPQKPQHPTVGGGRFADVPSLDRPGHVDFGLWNVFLNPAIPKPQRVIREMLQQQYPGLPDEELLNRTLAAFKTPGLRDLGHSAPYCHTGRFGAVEDVLRFYADVSVRAREGAVRNSDAELARVYVGQEDVVPLAAFLRSLNEDYQ